MRIADATGWDETTIRRALPNFGNAEVGQKTTGKDGKQRPSTRASPAVVAHQEAVAREMALAGAKRDEIAPILFKIIRMAEMRAEETQRVIALTALRNDHESSSDSRVAGTTLLDPSEVVAQDGGQVRDDTSRGPSLGLDPVEHGISIRLAADLGQVDRVVVPADDAQGDDVPASIGPASSRMGDHLLPRFDGMALLALTSLRGVIPVMRVISAGHSYDGFSPRSRHARHRCHALTLL